MAISGREALYDKVNRNTITHEDNIVGLLKELRREQEILKMMVMETGTRFETFNKLMEREKRWASKPRQDYNRYKMDLNQLTQQVHELKEQLEIINPDSNCVRQLQQEVQILTQLFVHGQDIKTYDLSTTFPAAYKRIIELEKQRAMAGNNLKITKVQREDGSVDTYEELELSELNMNKEM
jgi:hypothetical protein